MDRSQSCSTLVVLAKQLERADDEIVALRHAKPFYVSDLKKHVAQISHHLTLYPYHNWALSMQDSFNFICGFLALFYAGKQPILINPLLHELRDNYQAVLTDDDNHYERALIHPLVNITQIPTYDNIKINTHFISETFTLFTSGSTGLPKSITKTITQLDQESRLLSRWLTLHSRQLFVASVSHDHLYGLTFKIILALTNRCAFVCESIQYQEQLQNYSDQHIVYITTPSIIKNSDNLLPATSCDYVISAGGVLNYQDAQRCLQAYGVLPNEIYGSSETGVIATRQKHEDNTPWALFPNMKIEIVNSGNTLLHSPLITTTERLNDHIRLVNKQLFHLDGRIDKIIKIAEKRVSLTYIECKLEALPEIDNAIVIPLMLETRTILAAVIKLSMYGQQRLIQGEHFSLSQYFRQQLKLTLPLVTVPKKWRFIDQFPVNNQGKTTYIELKSLFEHSMSNN